MPLRDHDLHGPFGSGLADRLASRVAGTALIPGNAVRLLRDAGENYPAWLDAIAAAERSIDFENYIVDDDEVGRRFADALIAKAAKGVAVRVLYDWLGCLGTPARFWNRLRAAGIAVRCFNPPRLDSPLGWLGRNHRKTLCVDGRVGYVSGLCVARRWERDPRFGTPWRDTGIELRGPAAAELAAAFARIWREAGPPEPLQAAAEAEAPPAGEVALRIVETRPTTMALYRLDQLVAATARRTLWLTDAYFVGTTAYVQALCDAARDGVDVRLLVPGASDLPVVGALSRAGYRPLIEAGIRVYEWNGPMLHAKSAVADGRWARIGSSNLNFSSWIGNWELDVAVEDAGFAAAMEAMYLEDLGNATEIVLGIERIRRRRGAPRPPRRRGGARLAAGAVGIGSAVGAAVTGHRLLAAAETQVLALAAGAILLAVVAALLMPWLVVGPLVAVGGWIAGSLLLRAWRLHRVARRSRARLREAAVPADPQRLP
ncbi:MAG TPA: phospholipase D-like domain-containing protein [Alphaproteobacteria bacterium]|nr:phospholipase D-like domain-containing protein [Alphaproteobacteria bacterium]